MNLLLLGITLACAGFVQGLTGFGFGLVSMSLLPLFMSVKQAAVISTAFSLLATVTTFIRHYRDYNPRLGAVFLLCVCVGLPVGVYFLERGTETLLVRVLGGLMVAYAAREFFLPARKTEFPKAGTIPLGLFSGAMSGAFNLGGIPTAAYAYAHPWTRGQIMAFLQVMITVSCLIRMALYHQAGLPTGVNWWQALLLAAPLYLTIWLGHQALQRIDIKKMRRGVFVFIAISGVYYLLLHK